MNTLAVLSIVARPRRGHQSAAILTAAAYAVVTAVALIVTAGVLSFERFELEGESVFLYAWLRGLAIVTLIIPVVVLASSGVRLSARSNSRRLSSLRLLGASMRSITAVTMIEAALTALVGGTAGVVLYAAIAPVVGLVEFRGQPVGASIWLSPLIIIGVVGSVGLLAAMSAVVGLRKISISPLGVRTRVSTPTPRWVRIIIPIVCLTAIAFAYTRRQDFGREMQDYVLPIGIMLVGLGLFFLAVHLFGPWLMRLVGRRQLASARTPERLLAARSILENPAATWREVSGLAMVTVVAGIGGFGASILDASAKLGAQSTDEALLSKDMVTGLVVTLICALITIGCATTITQSTHILDRIDLYSGLDCMGVPWQVILRSRLLCIMLPALVACGSMVVVVGVIAAPIMGEGGGSLLDPIALGFLGGTILVALVLARGALTLSTALFLTRGYGTVRKQGL